MLLITLDQQHLGQPDLRVRVFCIPCQRRLVVTNRVGVFSVAVVSRTGLNVCPDVLGIIFHGEDVRAHCLLVLTQLLVGEAEVAIDFGPMRVHIDTALVLMQLLSVIRRLEIARALATEPQLLLLDEPAAGMNATESDSLHRLILDLRARFKLTILLVEHDMRLVMNLCERIIVLNYGKIITDGRPDAVRVNPQVIAAYLGQDHSQIGITRA